MDITAALLLVLLPAAGDKTGDDGGMKDGGDIVGSNTFAWLS